MSRRINLLTFGAGLLAASAIGVLSGVLAPTLPAILGLALAGVVLVSMFRFVLGRVTKGQARVVPGADPRRSAGKLDSDSLVRRDPEAIVSEVRRAVEEGLRAEVAEEAERVEGALKGEGLEPLLRDLSGSGTGRVMFRVLDARGGGEEVTPKSVHKVQVDEELDHLGKLVAVGEGVKSEVEVELPVGDNPALWQRIAAMACLQGVGGVASSSRCLQEFSVSKGLMPMAVTPDHAESLGVRGDLGSTTPEVCITSQGVSVLSTAPMAFIKDGSCSNSCRINTMIKIASFNDGGHSWTPRAELVKHEVVDLSGSRAYTADDVRAFESPTVGLSAADGDAAPGVGSARGAASGGMPRDAMGGGKAAASLPTASNVSPSPGGAAPSL